jgi:rhomboid family GlyGly-CTERM serine protease
LRRRRRDRRFGQARFTQKIPRKKFVIGAGIVRIARFPSLFSCTANTASRRFMLPPLKSLLAPRLLPWFFLPGGVLSLLAATLPAWREALVYDRAAILAGGEWWRLWTGNFTHFGWWHFAADTGLYFLIGWALEYRYRWFITLSGLVLMPFAVTLAVFLFDSEMTRYAGLSGINVGFLILLALLGWQASWRDWFWPALLGIHVLELILEINQGHFGGAMIAFDEPGIRIATLAHVGGGAFGIAMWITINLLKTQAFRPHVVVADAAAEKAG